MRPTAPSARWTWWTATSRRRVPTSCGCRSDIRTDRAHVRLRGVHHRCVRSADRRLADLELVEERPGPWMPWSRRSASGWETRASAQFITRTAAFNICLFATLSGSRSPHRALGREPRRLLRQRAGRDDHRALQDRAHLPPRSVVPARRHRARHPRVGLVVQQPPPAQADRPCPTAEFEEVYYRELHTPAKLETLKSIGLR